MHIEPSEPWCDSVMSWRLCSAEESVLPGRSLTDADHLAEFIAGMQACAWWQSNVAYRPTIHTSVGGHELGGGGQGSHAQAHRPGIGVETTWDVSIAEVMLTEKAVIHEVAHTIAPRWIHGAGRGHQTHPSHGPAFAGTVLALANEFAPDVGTELAVAYAHFGVEPFELDEYRLAVGDSLRAEAEILAWVPGQGRFPAAGMVAATLGTAPLRDQIWMVRDRRSWSVEQLADAVSSATPCTAEDIEIIEEESRPLGGMPVARAAYGAAMVLDLDPVMIAGSFGLDVTAALLTRRERMILNPGQVELVDELVELLRGRPAWTE